MNLVDCKVEEVISEPYYQYNSWFVNVMTNSWGHISEGTIMFKTKEEALDVKPGYVFQA